MYGSAELQQLHERAFVVPPEQLSAAWPAISSMVSRVTHAAWSLEDVRRELEQSRAQAWGMREGSEVRCILITRVENTFSSRYGVLWIAAGSGILEGMRLFREYIEPWFFDEQGCEWIEIQGRRGWARLLSDYQQSAVILTKYKPNTARVH